jgi:hypothetical protein
MLADEWLAELVVETAWCQINTRVSVRLSLISSVLDPGSGKTVTFGRSWI